MWLLEAVGPLSALKGAALEVSFFEDEDVVDLVVGGGAGSFAILDCLRRAGLFSRPSVARVLACVDFLPERLNA